MKSQLEASMKVEEKEHQQVLQKHGMEMVQLKRITAEFKSFVMV